MQLNKFGLGDSILLNARVIGVEILEDGVVEYKVIITDRNGVEDTLVNIDETMMQQVF